MERVYVFLIQNDGLIYIIAGLALVWPIYDLIRSRRLSRQAMFGLEKERAQSMRNNALVLFLLFGGILALALYVNLRIAPTLPAELLRPPTPTPNPFTTPLASPSPPPSRSLQNSTPSAPLVPTITLSSDSVIDGFTDSATPSGTETPLVINRTPGSQAGAGCSNNHNIAQPASGSILAGSVPFFGTAAGPAFSFYKMEIRGPQTNSEWASLLGTTVGQPIVDGLLGRVNLGSWANGQYEVRLTIVDETSNESTPCTVTFLLNNP